MLDATWATFTADELVTHARMPLVLVDSVNAVHQVMADDILEQIILQRKKGEPCRFIWPVGPIGQYDILVEKINAEGIRLDHVWIFMMDEYVDTSGRLIDEAHPVSFIGYMKRYFFARIHPELRPQEDQIWYPHPARTDEIDATIDEIGGIDCCYGGVGIHGHVAFNEAPVNRWHEISIESYRNSRTRVIQLAPETIVTNAIQTCGGDLEFIPTAAVTLGMRAILGARRLRLYFNRSSWQRAILRRAVLEEPTVRYPVTLAQDHPDVLVVANRETAQPPRCGLV